MSKQNRRDFLENSMLAAAAAAVAAGPATSELVAAEEGSSSPNEKLRVAVLGVRGRGGSHISAFSRRKDTEVAVLCDPDEAVGNSRVESLKKSVKYEVKYENDLRRVMEDKSIDIVTIATPNHWHSLAAIWAIQAGKDVYCEKPVSHNVSEGRRVVEAARKHNKIVQTGTQSRSNGGMRDAIQYIKEGKLGKVYVARGLCFKPRNSIGARGNYDVPASVNYDVWLGPAPKKGLTRSRFHYDWHWQWDYGNGDLGNQGIHQMDIARWGLGVDTVGDSVLSYGGRVGYEDAGDTANSQVSIHQYGKQRLVFEVRGLKTAALRGAKVGVIFYGTEGTLVIGSYAGGVVFDKEGNMIKKFSGGGDHFGNFLTAVRSRKTSDLNADILEGHLSSALCHLGNVSYRLGESIVGKEVEERLQGDAEALLTFERFGRHLEDNKVMLAKTKLSFGKKLALDSKQEVFTGRGVENANAMLTREYRKGFVVPDSKDV
jgi:predicted dehydrogenase